MKTHTLTTDELPCFTHSDVASRHVPFIPFVLKRRIDAPSFSSTPLNDLAHHCYSTNGQWWHDLHTGERLNRNKGELLMLMVSEIAEAMEGERKDLMDTHLTHRKMAEVELADTLIRIFDYAGAFGYDLDGSVREKLEYNKHREDHKREARLAANGKKF